jgi:hypothetical protein
MKNSRKDRSTLKKPLINMFPGRPIFIEIRMCQIAQIGKSNSHDGVIKLLLSVKTLEGPVAGYPGGQPFLFQSDTVRNDRDDRCCPDRLSASAAVALPRSIVP